MFVGLYLVNVRRQKHKQAVEAYASNPVNIPNLKSHMTG